MTGELQWRSSIMRISLLLTLAPLVCCFSDQSVLLSFKQSLFGKDVLPSWNTSMPVSAWEGTVWQHNVVQDVNLSSMGLQGHLKPFWCNLTQPKLIDLSSNDFTGAPLTATWCSTMASSLEYLFLQENQLSGQLQQNIGSTTLVGLDLGFNFFSGPLPKNLENLTALKELLLFSNSFSGAILPELGKLSQIQILDLGSNIFGGEIPSALVNCTKLSVLRLSGNHLTGSIPYELGSLPDLQVLDAQYNELSHALDGFKSGYFQSLQYLILEHNGIRGPIPDSFSNCTNLQVFNIALNRLNGGLPNSLFVLSKLQILELSANAISGKVPYSILNCTSLRQFNAGSNSLTSIPRGITNISTLEILEVSHNKLSGSLPEQYGDNIQVLSLQNNFIFGSIPSGMSAFSRSIQVLALGDNMLEGSIPSWLGNCTRLVILELRRNMFSGSIPKELGSLPSLSDIRSPGEDQTTAFRLSKGGTLQSNGFRSQKFGVSLAGNRLTGMIPKQLGLLKGLQFLGLCCNHLSGTIPTSLGNAESIEFLDLGNNRLSGSIPSELTKLKFLSQLNLSNNLLSGPIPQMSQFSTFTSASFLGNRGLCGSPLNVTCPHNMPSAPDAPDGPEQGWGLTITVGLTLGFPVGFGVVYWWPWTSAWETIFI